MKRPILRHLQCPNAQVGNEHPRMGEFSDESVVFVSGQKNESLTVRIPYVCPECGFTVQVDLE